MLLVIVALLVIRPALSCEIQLNQVTDTSRIFATLRIDTFHLSVYPPSSGVQFYKEGIIFLSASKNEQVIYPGYVSFGALRIYYAALINHGTGIHYDFAPDQSFSCPADAISFSIDYNEMYFTRVYKAGRTSIFYASEPDGNKSWNVDRRPMNFCNSGYSYTHPAISADGKFLIFSSDMEGTTGGMDLFITRREGTSWSEPVNLGQSINTQWNEMFPFLDKDNNLYFSSDRQGTLGGYDIFMYKYNGQGWDRPVKLDELNTEQDDIAFTMSKEGRNIAFFSRRYESGHRYNIMLLKVALRNDKVMKGEDGQLSAVLYDRAPQYKEPEPVAIVLKKNDNITVKNQGTEQNIKSMQSREGFAKTGIDLRKEGKIHNVTLAVSKKDTIEAKPEKIIKKDTIQPVVVKTPEKVTITKDMIVYRVQILSSSKSKKPYQISINGVTYLTYEYYYQGAYRTTIGEFTSPEPATELKDQCRKAGYPEAFRVAFRNNKRVGDAAIFK